MSHPFSEDQLVEQPAIGLFAEFGWATVSALEDILLPKHTSGEMAL
jgi:type I restriction enzyme, R subunit